MSVYEREKERERERGGGGWETGGKLASQSATHKE